MTQACETQIERDIRTMQKELKGISESLVELITNMKNHVGVSERNAQDIKELNVRVDDLDRKDASRDGGNKMFKGLIGIFSASILASCTWLFSSIQTLKEENVALRSEIQHLQVDVSEFEHKVGR